MDHTTLMWIIWGLLAAHLIVSGVLWGTSSKWKGSVTSTSTKQMQSLQGSINDSHKMWIFSFWVILITGVIYYFEMKQCEDERSS